ncbi:MAG: radical SAM protein [Deltaproteobacteria bacterium]|nr:radical SAM protein [Deltaproteobacteria bacterium]
MRPDPDWDRCRFLTASVLPVARACDLRCPFCFSRSSLSALDRRIAPYDLDAYFELASARGATRLVVTGGGEPLLRADEVVRIVKRGKRWFDEIACFTNATHLSETLADELLEAGLSYLCWSRHHHDDETNRAIMGAEAPALIEGMRRASKLPIRATCVMIRGGIETREDALAYRAALLEARQKTWRGAGGASLELTFKHTYVAFAESLFQGSSANEWASTHRVAIDPFEGDERFPVIASLPWGPRIRDVFGTRTCFYNEPTPLWEKASGLCRSANLLADGSVYASLEDARSWLAKLTIDARRPIRASILSA